MFNCFLSVTSCVVIKYRVVIPYFYYRSSFMILLCSFIILLIIVFLFIMILSCFIYRICRVLFVVLSFYFILFWSMLFFWPIFHVRPKAHLALFAGPSPAQLQGSCKLTQEWRPKLHSNSTGPTHGLLRMRPTKQTSPCASVRDPAGLLHLSPSHA